MTEKRIPDEFVPESIPEEFKNQRYGLDILRDSNELFHCGQSYTKRVASVIECRVCKGKEFNVARDSYWTGVRCVTCKYEVCVHDG